MKKRYKITALLSAAVISFSFAGCGNVGFRLSDILESAASGEEWNSASSNEMSRESSRELSHESSRETSHESSGESSRASSREASNSATPEKTYKDFYSLVPPYDGSPSVAINNDKPFFDRSALTLELVAVTICSDLGAQTNKVCHCFHYFPIYLPIYLP